MKSLLSLFLAIFTACSSASSIKPDSKNNSSDVQQETHSCPKQQELKPLSFEVGSRQYIGQHRGTNCNGLAYVQACSVIPTVDAVSKQKSKKLVYAANTALIFSELAGSSPGSRQELFFEFHVADDQTQLLISIADIKQLKDLRVTVTRRDGFQEIASADFNEAVIPILSGRSLLNDSLKLPSGDYSLRMSASSGEISGVTVEADHDIEDLGVVPLESGLRAMECE